MIKIVLAILLLLVIGGGALLGFKDLGGVFDFSPPVLSSLPSSLMVGQREVTFSAVSEDSSGIGSASLELCQNEKCTPVPVTIERSDTTQSLRATISLAGSGYVNGAASLRLSCVDASAWKNSATFEIPATIDTKAPRLEVLTLSHAVSQGGAELILYRVHDEDIARSGVNVGGAFYQGVPASALTPNSQKGVYAALFPIPLDYNETQVLVEAYDIAGNLSSSAVGFRLLTRKALTDDVEITEKFVQNKVKALESEFLLSVGAERNQTGSTEQEKSFRTVNEGVRAQGEEKLRSLLSAPSPAKYWDGLFIRPMAGSLSSNYGEYRTYLFNGASVGNSFHNGFDIASVRNDVVRATNAGVVVFAGDLGVYGQSVLIDHGMGLSSLYGHLSSLLVQQGDKLSKGQELGRSGESGFAGGDHLHFEFRIQNTPVTPIEWWDKKWYDDNILLRETELAQLSALK